MDRLAKTGNAQAIYNQGFMSELGQGTAQDSKKRLLLIRKHPIKVIQVATYRLAQIYMAGELGVTKDEKKGREYLKKPRMQVWMKQP